MGHSLTTRTPNLLDFIKVFERWIVVSRVKAPPDNFGTIMPGKGTPRRASAASSTPATPKSTTPKRNGDIRTMFSRQSAQKKALSPDASPAPPAKRARRDGSVDQDDQGEGKEAKRSLTTAEDYETSPKKSPKSEPSPKKKPTGNRVLADLSNQEDKRDDKDSAELKASKAKLPETEENVPVADISKAKGKAKAPEEDEDEKKKERGAKRTKTEVATDDEAQPSTTNGLKGSAADDIKTEAVEESGEKTEEEAIKVEKKDKQTKRVAKRIKTRFAEDDDLQPSTSNGLSGSVADNVKTQGEESGEEAKK